MNCAPGTCLFIAKCHPIESIAFIGTIYIYFLNDHSLSFIMQIFIQKYVASASLNTNQSTENPGVNKIDRFLASGQ